jgi:nitroreductase
MTVLEAIRKRYSCRAYQDKSIEPEKLDSILEAARLAPSARNMQDWRFVVVTASQVKRQLTETTNKPDVFAKAGAIIAACSNSNYVMPCGQAAAPIDVSIALEHICLQATELGLGTCWIGSFDPEKTRSMLGIPTDIEVIELLAVGYPADSKPEPKRESIDKIVSFEKWKF